MATRRVFTLIELLVVVSIIAILAAMLLPALSRARERVRMDVCNNNLRTFGLAFELYADDMAEFLPQNSAAPCPTLRAASGIGGANPDFQCYWAYKVQPYITDLRFFLCTDHDCVRHTLHHPLFPRYVATTYGTSLDIEAGANPKCNSRTRVLHASTLILFGHACRCDSPNRSFMGKHTVWSGAAPEWRWWPGWHGPNVDNSGNPLDTYMLGKDGFLIADGHVEVFGREALLATPEHWDP